MGNNGTPANDAPACGIPDSSEKHASFEVHASYFRPLVVRTKLQMPPHMTSFKNTVRDHPEGVAEFEERQN